MPSKYWREPLTARLHQHFALASIASVAAATTSAPTHADVVYTAVNWPVAANNDGLYIDVETLVTASTGTANPTWDLNAYGTSSLTWFNASGTGMMRYPGTTTGSAGSLLPGMLVGPLASFGNGAVTVGTGSGMWRLNDSNYFGFRFVASDGQTHYGWGRFEIGSSINGADRRITEIAWETTPGVGILVNDVDGETPYDPCAPWNPIVTNGAATVAYREAAADITTSCGMVRAANYYQFVPSTSGLHTIRVCDSSSPVRLAVFSDCDSSAAELACGTTSCGELGSSADIELTQGSPIYIVVGGATAKSHLGMGVTIEVETPPVAACVDAPYAFFGPNAFVCNGPTSQTVRSRADGATTATMFRAIWFRFIPAVSGAYSLRTCGSTGDSLLAIGTACANVEDRFEAIAFNDDAPNCQSGGSGNLASFIDATNNGATGSYAGFPLIDDLIAGRTYYILVGSYSASASTEGILLIDGPTRGNPNDPDADGLIDALDNCSTIFNPKQEDCNADGIGDVCELAAGEPDINQDSILDECQCLADLFADGVVNGADLGVLLSQWGLTTQVVAGDINRDGTVNGADLAILLSGWGPCE